MRLPLAPIALLALAACQQPADKADAPAADATDVVSDATVEAPAAMPPEAAATEPQYAAWVGAWKGPEGTSLVVEPAGAGYTVKITDLDGTKTYAGTPAEHGIVIERGREPLTIRAGSGDETGMKWLAGKKDCLVVAANEGYCRD